MAGKTLRAWEFDVLEERKFGDLLGKKIGTTLNHNKNGDVQMFGDVRKLQKLLIVYLVEY